MTPPRRPPGARPPRARERASARLPSSPPLARLRLRARAAVTATGLIWVRYSTAITPVNYNLMAVNACMAVTGLYQLSRKYMASSDAPAAPAAA